MRSKIEIRNGALHTNNPAAFAREFDVPQPAQASMLLMDLVTEKEVEFLKRCCRRWLRNESRHAEDAVQETLLRIVRVRAVVENRDHAYGFLYRASQFACSKILRDVRRHRRRDLAGCRPEVTEESAAYMAEQADSVRAIRCVVHRTLDPITAACVLRRIDGQTLTEMGEAFGISHQTAGARIRRGVGKLRRRIAAVI